MIHAKLIYHATGIKAEYTPGNASFSCIIHKIIRPVGPGERWKSKGDGTLDLVCADLTEQEAASFEYLGTRHKLMGEQINLVITGKPVDMNPVLAKIVRGEMAVPRQEAGSALVIPEEDKVVETTATVDKTVNKAARKLKDEWEQISLF